MCKVIPRVWFRDKYMTCILDQPELRVWNGEASGGGFPMRRTTRSLAALRVATACSCTVFSMLMSFTCTGVSFTCISQYSTLQVRHDNNITGHPNCVDEKAFTLTYTDKAIWRCGICDLHDPAMWHGCAVVSYQPYQPFQLLQLKFGTVCQRTSSHRHHCRLSSVN